MDIRLDQDWRLRPIKGDTGKAYIGLKDNDKVFIKRNTTPMLAALSKEGLLLNLCGPSVPAMAIRCLLKSG